MAAHGKEIKPNIQPLYQIKIKSGYEKYFKERKNNGINKEL
jgi:hypothetical protein